ncbi:MAG TPA: hypothetical protein VK610_03445 [Rhodothermales bacterium]|nr:hypothetical protein [Rhodothermales bacterium]
MRVPYALLVLLLAVAACAGPSGASRYGGMDPSDPRFADVVDSEELAESFIDDLGDRLRRAGNPLTPAQRDALFPLLLEGSDDLRIALSMDGADDGGPGRQAALQRLAAARQRLDPRIHGVLSPAQFTIYDRLLDERLSNI